MDTNTPGYGGEPAFFKECASEIKKGKTVNSLIFKMSNHVGTHIDVPYHFDENGKKLDEYSDDFWIFQNTYVLNLNANKDEIIEISDPWNEIPKNCDLLLIRTGFEEYRSDKIYWSNNPGLSDKVGLWVRSHRPSIRVMGLDFISVTAFQNRPMGRQAHQTLLGPGAGTPVCVIEDMRLSHLNFQPRKIVVSPLFVRGADGGQVTVFAFAEGFKNADLL